MAEDREKSRVMTTPPNAKLTLPDVTIYVASINTSSATELCVRSIVRYTPKGTYTLCVGDCGSTDATLPRLMRLLHQGLIDDVEVAPRGRTHGSWLDLWTNTCATRFAVVVDSDVEILRQDWLEVLVSPARAADAAIVCSEVLDEVPNYIDQTGVARRLAPRPSAWMMLVDVGKCRGLSSWQFAMESDPDIPEKQWGLDTGAQLMRMLKLAGEDVVVTPPEFQGYFRHFGGLSWIKMTPSNGWKYRASLFKVRLLNLFVLVRLNWLKASEMIKH